MNLHKLYKTQFLMKFLNKALIGKLIKISSVNHKSSSNINKITSNNLNNLRKKCYSNKNINYYLNLSNNFNNCNNTILSFKKIMIFLKYLRAQLSIKNFTGKIKSQRVHNNNYLKVKIKISLTGNYNLLNNNVFIKNNYNKILIDYIKTNKFINYIIKSKIIYYPI